MSKALPEIVREAAERLKGVISPTPLIHSSSLSTLFGFECLLKLENLQKTGSFKARGAYFKISSLSEREISAGVIAASSGNHAQGVAWAAALLGVRSLIVMPETTPIVKFVATKGYGGEVVIRGRNFMESFAYARDLSTQRGMALIHPFDDYSIIAGQGTIGLEIMEAAPDADAIVVPVGGGGLISGIASAVKEKSPGIRVIGAEAAASNSCIESIKRGEPSEVEERPTIADGIAVKRPGEKTFKIIRELVDEVHDVGEDSIAWAIVQLLERKKLVVEGAGAVGVAAAIEGKLPKSVKRAVFVLSGGNIDVTTLDRIIRLGLIREGRILRLAALIPDEPGALARLTADIAALKANILHVIHEREAVSAPINTIRLEIVLETEGHGHSEKIRSELKGKGYGITE